jgi:large subunit ribosomal protein L25
MEKIVIQAERREVTGKKVGALRREGKLPGVMYGRHIDSTPIVMDLRDTSKTLHGLSASSIVTIVMDGKDYPALVREKQRNYILGTLKHVDFQVVSMKEKIRTMVSIELLGASPAVKNQNGVVVHNLNEVEVEALPQDLPEKFELDLSSLAEIGNSLLVKDLKAGEGVEILTDLEETVVVITSAAQAVEEEGEELEEGAEEPEISEQRGKKEEEDED